MAPTRTGDNGTKKRGGRPPGSRKSDAVLKPAAKPGAKKRKGKRASQAEADDELSEIAADQIAEEPKSRKKYVQLEAKTKRIPQELIETWPQVSQQVLEQIVAVIRDAKKDIANTQRDERKVIAAHNALNPLVFKLTRQLAASRIPPLAKDVHFNIDKLTERNTQISREVTTARHSKQLLSEQVSVAERLLDKDEANLDQLKKDAKKWRTEWKHQEKNGRIHPLLQAPAQDTIHGDGPDDIRLQQSAPSDTVSLDTPDAELAPVLEQLQRSLGNMQGNHAHVAGISGAMRDVHAALDDVMFRHASTQQYTDL